MKLYVWPLCAVLTGLGLAWPSATLCVWAARQDAKHLDVWLAALAYIGEPLGAIMAFCFIIGGMMIALFVVMEEVA